MDGKMKTKALIDIDIHNSDRCDPDCWLWSVCHPDCNPKERFRIERTDACIKAERMARNMQELRELEHAKATGDFDKVWEKREREDNGKKN